MTTPGMATKMNGMKATERNESRRPPGFARPAALVLGAAAILLLWAEPAQAYIGPGAGIALVGSFMAVFLAVLSAVLAMLTWPLRWLIRLIRGRGVYARSKCRRVIVLGLDGLEPRVAEPLLEAGSLPNLARLREAGCYMRLGTTYPPLSPVSWASFSTGTNPGKHNIYDFISRNPVTYLPTMSSVKIREPHRTLKLFGFKIPLSKPEITWLRKSKSLWKHLGEYGVFSSVVRVPITFPPEKFHGVMLSAMCVPDLRGTQGTFTFYADRAGEAIGAEGDQGGERLAVGRNNGYIESHLVGPEDTLRVEPRPMRIPFRVEEKTNGGVPCADLYLDGQKIELREGEFTDWVTVNFKAGPGFKVRGACRLMLKQLRPEFKLYCTPIQIDPDKPVMPISHPAFYSQYLAKLNGTYSTLGLAEDTVGLSEKVLDEDAFLAQAYDIHEEREKMYFDALRRVKRGVVICVFDGPDRIQHMFWRFMDDKHPACSDEERESHREVIRDMYKRMDDLVGRTLARLGKDDVLIVMSDHGFNPFRRSVDLNAWLLENGYLVLKDGKKSTTETYNRGVDWSRTRAYAMGLAGMFVNQKGRESQGIVEPGEETHKLQREIAEKLTALRDPDTGEKAIHAVYPREEIYTGPYTVAAPDLIVGYKVGYRVSWDSAVGKTAEKVVYDNTHAWSGDHCIDPHLVPGVLFSNLQLNPEGANIIDLAPTMFDLFGVKQPGYLDGKSLLGGDGEVKPVPVAPVTAGETRPPREVSPSGAPADREAVAAGGGPE